MIGQLFPQGGQGFGAALQDASPLLLAMAQGLQSGQGAFAQAPQGIAAMMQAANKRQGDQIFRDVMGGGVNTGQAMQAPVSAAGLMGASGSGGTVRQAGVPQGVNPAIAGAFPQSLIRTESGGNWNALNNEQGAGGRGHGGRLQFGTGRLQDAARAGVIGGMTPQEFAQQPPEVQQQVEAWHFADIDRQAQSRGLGRYIGQNVGGIPITQDAIRAMAHLGGIGGAARFLESGGQYNPADANGTSLADYARIHGGAGQNQYGQTVQMEQPDPARLSRLYEAFGNPNLSPEQRQAIGLRIQAEEQRTQPMTPLQQIQLQTAQLELQRMQQPQREQPIEVGGVLLDPQTYQPIFDSRSAGGDNQTERDISLLGEIGIPRDRAIEITQLHTTARDPVTGEVQIINRATGQPVGGVPAQAAPAAPAMAPAGAPTSAASAQEQGLQFPAAAQSFGLGGAARGVANRIADVAGMEVPFPDVQETQSDFAVLRESLLNDIAAGYGRQPPSWLLQEIRSLTPAAGSPMQGAGSAQSQLQALRRHFITEGQAAEQALQRRLSPTERQAAEARAASLRGALNRVDSALGAFGGGQRREVQSDGPVVPTAPSGSSTSSGVQWRIVE